MFASRQRPVLLFLFLTLLLSAGMLNAQPDALPRFVSGPCPVAFAGDNVECGTVTVLQDRLHPEERSLDLAVAIFRAQTDGPAPDPLIFLDGGPGARTLESFAGGLMPLLTTINRTRDVILFDYRGIGYSDPALTCTEAVAAADGWIETCRARFAAEGVDVTDFTTRDNAADAADIIQALGYTTYNIWGGSYGSSVAMAMLREQPEHLRAALVTALQLPQGDLQADTPVNIMRTLNAVSELCQADAACAAAFPGDLGDQVAVAVEQVEANPVPIPESMGGGELNGIGVLVAVSELAKDEARIPDLPGLIAALAAGQYDWALPYGNALRATTLPPASYGAWLSMRCTDSILATTNEAIRDGVELVPVSLRTRFLAVHELQIAQCEAWGAREPVEADRAVVATDNPVLILGGAIDPFSSEAWMNTALETLPNGQGYLLPWHMHYVIHNPCAADLLVSFLEDPAAELNTECLAGIAPPAFNVP